MFGWDAQAGLVLSLHPCCVTPWRDSVATMNEPASPREIKNIHNCSRCGGDHGPVVARPLTIPFAPEEACGLEWTHWFPCPTNGEPVLMMFEAELDGPVSPKEASGALDGGGPA
jgi:hypothetical protein